MSFRLDNNATSTMKTGRLFHNVKIKHKSFTCTIEIVLKTVGVKRMHFF